MTLKDIILRTRFRQNDFMNFWLPEMENQLSEKSPGVGSTPLHIAAMADHVVALKHLLQLTNRPALTIKDYLHNDTPLLWSIANCNISASLILLDSNFVPNQDEMKAQINQPCIDGNTPLILSLAKGWHHHDDDPMSDDLRPQSVVASRLLKLGANVDSKNTWGCTALHYACWHRDIEAIAQLIKQGANLFEVNNEGKTAFELMSCSYEEAKQGIYNCVSSVHTLDKNNWDPKSKAGIRFARYHRELEIQYGLKKLPQESSNACGFFPACSPETALIGAALGALLGAGLSVLTGGVGIILIAACLGCFVGIVGSMLHDVYSESSQEESNPNFCC